GEDRLHVQPEASGMQSGNSAASDIFAACDHPATSVGAVPAGSRLAQYLHGSNAQPPVPRQSSWNSPLSQSQSSGTPYGISSQSTLQPSNVPSYMASFAQMGLGDDKDLNPSISVAPFSMPSSSQRPINYAGPTTQVLTASPVLHDPLRASGHLAEGGSASGYMQENYGGTTYFFQQGANAGLEQPREDQPNDGRIVVTTPGCFAYQGPLPHIGKFKPKGSTAQSFFTSPELKMELLQRQLAVQCRADPTVYGDLPQALEHFQNLVPLEPLKMPSLGHGERGVLGPYTSSVYKATSIRDGMPYCIRRIHNYRVNSAKHLSLADNWKKLIHANVVQLREVLVTRHFGDHSLLFVYDFHPLSETMKFRHLSSRINGMSTNFMDGMSGGGLQESLIWTYIVQLSSALRAIHSSGMAARTVDPTKIIVFSKTKLMLSSCGVLDVINPENNHNSIQHQQEDLCGLGRVIVALAMGSLHAARRENLSASLAVISQHYTADMKNIISLLLSASAQGSRVRSINEVMPMIGARFYAQLELAQMKNDLLENELSKELENGRLFRLLCKLNTIIERPQFQMDMSWSETGDRYLLKLFRDYLFHQVTEAGKPWIDMAHIISCLNKLDAGLNEKIQLVSRDGDNVLVVSFLDLRRCLENAFRELHAAATAPPPPVSIAPPLLPMAPR
uniref:PAN2-PAN3 deadenylation complex subunit PAN3 n=1 Tax=Parascaris univalens TaxID=6257 RepID=A0A915AFQ2_PARUN